MREYIRKFIYANTFIVLAGNHVGNKYNIYRSYQPSASLQQNLRSDGSTSIRHRSNENRSNNFVLFSVL